MIKLFVKLDIIHSYFNILDSPAVSPDRTNSRKASPQPNDKAPFTTKNPRNDSPISNRKPSGPIQQKEPYHVPQYDSPKSKPTSVHPQSISPERTTINRDTTKTNKLHSTHTREDITNDYENSSKPTTREPHYASPISKSTSRHPSSSTSPERTTSIKDDLTMKTTKTNKVDKTVTREDTTYDYEDSSEPSHQRQPHYASPIISKPSSRYPSSTSPERTTTIRDDLTTKTTKTNKLDSTVVREDITNDYENSSKPTTREPHYASPILKSTSRHPSSSTSPERTTTIRDDLTTKTTKTNRTVTREDTANDYEDSSEPSHHRQPHYASPIISKPSSRYPSSNSPERTKTIRDDLTTKTTKINKVERTMNREDTTNDYEDSSEPSHHQQPHYASPIISKPSSRYPSSTSPEITSTIRDNLTTKTTKTNKVERTMNREDTTNDYEDSSEPSHHRQPHYASPIISKPSSRYPSSTSPERTSIIRDDLTTKTTKTNKVDRTVTREDTTNDYEDNSKPTHPREPHYASPISKSTSRHPSSSTSPERTTTIRDNLTTKTTKTNRTVTREDTANDYEDSSEPSHHRQPHYASPIISKPSSRYPSSNSPERTKTIRDDLTTKTTKINKVDSTVIREDTKHDYDASSQPSRSRQPHYDSPTSKPTSRHSQSTSPDRTTITRDDLTTTTTKTNKLDSTITREDTTYKYEDSVGPSCPRKPHYDTPKSKPTGHPQSTSPERTTIIRDDSTTKTSRTNKYEKTLIRADTTDDIEENTDIQKPRQPRYDTPSEKSTSRYPQSSSPDRTSITRDDLTLETKTTKVTNRDTTYDYKTSCGPPPRQPPYPSPDDLTTETSKTTTTAVHDHENRFEPSYPQKPHYASPISKTSRHPQSPERTVFTKDDLRMETKTKKATKDAHYDSPKSKPTSRHPQSPERTTISRDDLTMKTSRTNKLDSTITYEDTTHDFEDDSDTLNPTEPNYGSPVSKPSSKYAKSTSPERITIARDDVTETNKFESTITRENNLYDHDDISGPYYPRDEKLQPTIPKSNAAPKFPKSSSPERTTVTKNDETTDFTKIKTNSILRDTTKKYSKTSDDEGIEPESPRSHSPTSDFEYRRNTEIKSKMFTTDLDSENIYIRRDSNKIRDEAFNTEFITKEKENVYRETSPVQDKYRPRSTTQEYFDQTEKIENMRYPSSKSPEDNKPKEPFFLRENSPYEKNGSIKPDESPKTKTKAPFNRRETFDERCRQVLGINDVNEINESTSVTMKHNNTSKFIDNEKNVEDILKIRKSSTPSPVPSPRSSSPKKTTPEQDHVNKTTNKFIKHEKEIFTERDSATSRSVSPGSSPVRKTSPQRSKPTATIKDVSYVTHTKTMRQKAYSPKDTPTGSPYTRSPESSPVRRPKSPDHFSNITTTTEHKTVSRDQSPESQTHITIAKIKISPSTPKSNVTETNLMKPQKPKSSTVNYMTTTTSTTTGNRNTTKDTKSSPDNNRPNYIKQSRKNVPLIHKKSDSELDKESDIEDDDVITTTTTKITKTTNKKSTPNKKLVTERKESAPVYRTTQIDREQKMIRSTSDNILKAQKRTKLVESDKLQNISSVGPKSPRKTSLENKKDLKTEKRPNKCLTTKTINLSTKTNIINSEDMENVIIDIQQAKSSREPSPNKMVPIPVPLNEDTGKPRYPDKVQEPEEDLRRTKIKNVPIYEEAKDDFVGCHISEVRETDEEYLRSKHLSRKLFNDEKTTMKSSVEIDTNTNFDEDCLLSVHDKVSKFINTAEEVKKPKSSAPFQRDVPQMNFSEDDDCLLSVNDKVNKFLTTAEKVTKDIIISTGKRIETVNLDEIDKNLREDECNLSVSQKVNKFINTAEKLVETQPQKSPELVAKIEKQISRQSDDDRNDEENINTKTTKVKSRITERYTPDKPKREPLKTNTKPVIKSTDAVRKAKSVFEKNELKDIKLSKTTTTTKQRDIISRPSVWESKKQETVENRKNIRNREDTEYIKTNIITKPVSLIRNLDNNPSDNFGNTVITSKTELSRKAEDVTARLTRKTTPRRPSDTTSNINSDKKMDTVSNITEYIDEYTNKFGKIRPKDYSPNTSPDRGTSSPKHPVDVKTEYTDEYTDKYAYTEKNISKKNSSSSITSKKVDQRYPEQSPTRVSRKPTESLKTHSDNKPETYTPSWSKNKQPKQSSPTRKESDSPTRLTSSYAEENTYSSYTTNRDNSPTRPSSAHYNKRPDDHSPARSINRYTEEQKSYRTSTRQNGTPSPSISDRKYLFENIDTNAPRPSYMDHTKASLEHIRRDSFEVNRNSYNRRVSVDEESFDGNPRSAVKFGVDLKHHDESKPRRKSSSPEIPHIEEIFELGLLEQMLSVVVGYEQRRRIRSQIRIVKKMIEQKAKEEAQIAYIRETSPARRSGSSERENSISSITRKNIRNKTEDEQVAYIRETSPARRSSPTRSVTSTSSQKKNIRTKSNSSFIESESKHIEKHEKIRDRSPQSKTKTVTTIRETRKIDEKPKNKTKPVPIKDSKPDEKPIWATKNILKKPSENNHSPKTSTTKKIHTSTTKTTQSQRQKISSDEDCITSSYGIGPTDEDGRPLFGIRALKKKQQPSETTKVTGTMITENYYSENGSTPLGERTVTVYSSNPNDIDEYESKFDHTKRSGSIKRESSKQNGLTTVTRTQKFGDDYPIHDTKYHTLRDDLTSTNSKSSKVNRKSSVKEISDKFIRKESSSSVTEKKTSTSSTSYPKAGLILRTKTTNRESNPTEHRSFDDNNDDYDYEYDNSTRHSQLINESESDSESCKITRTINKSTKSFLNTTGSKITGVDDVLERMRNADNVTEDGDTVEDQEARALLNKFLGATVLMSGVESMAPKEVFTTRTIKVEGSGPRSTQEVKTTRVTKNIKTEGSSSSPVAQQTCDIEEIWDIEFLKELLEQSTSYEERSTIRARIKQLMAEREACAEIVASVNAELQSPNAKKQSSKVETTTKKIVTTTTTAKKEEEEEVSDDGEEGEEEEEEVDDSSSEYEEIIVEVTDSEDDEVEIKETLNVVKTTQLNPNDKKIIDKTIVQSQTNVTTEQQAKQLPCNSKQIKVTTTKTDNSNKDNIEGKIIKNVDEDLSEGSESLLLPLLQGLLHKNMPTITHNQTTKTTNPKSSTNTINSSSSNNRKINNVNSNNNDDSNKQVNNTKKTIQIMNTQSQQKNQTNANKSISSLTNNNKKKNTGHHHIEDSGTESGEDLRLIAAGLRDTMQIHSIKDPSDTGLISEVTTALNRLEQSLKEGKHIKLESSKRNALLNLVGRLQTGLISPDKIPPPTPAPDQTGEMETSSPEADNHRGSNRQRFAKRRSRANRHTVGVSREELADARRYMEEMVMIENMSNCTTPESSAVTPSDLVPQPVKNEESSVVKPAVKTVNQQQQQLHSSTLYRPNQFVPNNLKDTTAGGSHEEYIPDNSGVQMRGKKPTYEPNQRLSGNLDQQGPVIASRRPLSDSYTAAFGQQIQNQTYKNAAQPHFNEIVNHQQPQLTDHKKQPTYENNPYTAQQSTNSSQYGSAFNGVNPLEQPYECVSPNNVPLNRFSNKKLAMKRANTIDIPKPMKYLHDMESDSDAEERGVSSTKSIGLRGTVQVSVKTKPRQVVPAFQPKTENDIKFLQFIQKQGSSTGLGWNNPNRTVSNWTNKFGNIKNSFESGATSMTSKPPVPASAAKNFWKKTDSQQNVNGKTLISKVSNAPKTLSRPPWADQNYSSNVLTSALKTKERNEYPTTVHGHSSAFDQQYAPMQPQQHEYAQLSQHETMQQQHPQMRQQQSPVQRQYMQSPQNHIPQQQIIKPKPISLNNFSHAPQSVFKPVDPVTPEYPERFKPIHTDPRLHQSEPHLNFQSNSQMYHDQIIQQEQSNKPWSLVGKYSAPSSPHHSIPSPTKSWFTTKTSTPSSPVTSTLPWLSKNKIDNRIRTKAEKFDKRSPPPSNLQRHNSLRGKDQDYQNRMSSYDLDKIDLKRPSLPNTSEPYVNGVYQSQPFYGSNPKINHVRQEPQYQPTDCQYQQLAPVTKYQQSPQKYQQSVPVGQYHPLPPTYNSTETIQQASLKSDNTTQYRQPSTQYKSVSSPTYQTIPYTSTDYSEPAISTFVQSRTREQSLTNPNAEPLVLTSAKPSFGPTVPLKIFDYPSPSCSISSPNFTQNDATDDDLDPESMTEYKTETKVMTGPVGQQAVTVGNKTRHVGNEEKHTSGAKDLLSVMKNLGNVTLSKDKKSSNVCLSPDGRTYQAPLVQPIFPEAVASDQNRMPTYIESNPLAYQTQNAQPFANYQTQTSNSGLASINGSDPAMTIQTQYQKNPTYVPPVQQIQNSAMYTGYPPGYRLPPEANTEFDFKSNQSYQPVPELNDNHNMHQQQIQNYQPVDLRQNQSYEPPMTRVQKGQPFIESHQLPNHNNEYQYPDVQKNLNQHREIHDNYPKQFDFQLQQHEYQKQEQQYQASLEKPRKKSMPKVDFKDASRSTFIPENPPKPNVQPKITYQDLKPVKRQDTTTSIKPDPHQTYLKPTEIDPQSPKFYVDAQPTHQFVKKPESKLINKENAPRQLQNTVEESRHQNTLQQSKLYKSEQKSKVIYEQSKKQVKSSNKVEQKQQKQQHSEVSTKVHTQQKVFQENKTNIKTLSETEKRSTSTKVISAASHEIIEKEEYKSSAPTDTPDIVKSSLPKDENFPILKKFGPPQRHLYTPNAYKSPLGRSDSNTDVKPAGPIMTRKFSDPSIMAKFSAPEIIETPSTPMPADSKDDIPRNIVFNNVAQFSNMSRRISDTSETYQKFPVPNSRPNLLSKSDSWTKICQQQTSAKPPSPKFNQSGEFGGHGLRRAKSGHTLALPKMYEAGIKREEITEKQKTVAAYFSGNKSPNSLSRNSSQTNLSESISTNDTSISTTKRSSINRIKTSAKASINKQYPSTGLCRSATMPHILNLLDEKSTRSETTETKNEDGSVVTTTTKVTTRTVSSGSTTVPKQVSPFAKFKQLDKQNSITSQNSPKTPITPSGTNRGAPIFAFTDPTVAARAATAKEQLLHWCQMKTKEYENIQITNFSTSWNDGMAFCALIHHFLPDAFDFTKLTPKQRRYNFTLAFRVADEKAGIAPLLDVEDMVVMKRPDWKCVFTYVQSIHRHFRNCQ